MDYYKLKVLNHRKIFIILGIIVLLLGLGYYYFIYLPEDNNSDIVISTKEEPIDNVSKEVIVVEVKGYVSKPGVYTFNYQDDARINDLILKAGGLKKEADVSLINLSKRLIDEMSVIIYSKKEIEDYVHTQDELKRRLEICEIELKNTACITQTEIHDDNDLININTATKEELMSLSGIGEEKAKDIINYRERNPFKSIDELKNVTGIGENLFEKIKENITI